MKLRFLLVLLLIPPTGEASNEGAACFTIKDFIDRISNLPSMPNKALANIAKSSTCLVLEMKSENRDEPKSWRTGILISDDLVITCRHQSKPNQDISTDPNDWFVRFDYLEEIRYVDLKKLKDPAWVKIQKVEIAPDFAWHVKSEQDYKIHPFADWVVLKLETRQSRSVFPIQSMPYQNITTPFIPNHSAIKPAFYWKAGQYDNWQILTVKEAEEKVRLRQDFFLHPFYYPSEMLITFPSLSSPIINIANPSPYVLIEGKFVTHAGASGSPVINDQGRANSIHLVGQDNNQGKPDFSIGIVNTKGEVSKSIRYELLFDADIGSNLVKRNFENISVNTLWRTYKDQIDVGTLTNPKFYSWSEFVIPPIPFDRPYNPDRDRRYENVNGVPIRNDYWVNWHPEAKIGIAGGDQIYIVKSGVNYGFNMLGQTIYGLTASVNPPAEKASQVWVAATFASAAHNTVSENFIIEWDNGKSEKVPASEYNRAILGIPKILSHVVTTQIHSGMGHGPSTP